MKTLLFLRLDEYFYGSSIATGDQRATAKTGKTQIVNVIALSYNLTEIHAIPCEL
ncbi:hypothetical protein ACFL3Q_14470 [Planctomycetota bacterium]